MTTTPLRFRIRNFACTRSASLEQPSLDRDSLFDFIKSSWPDPSEDAMLDLWMDSIGDYIEVACLATPDYLDFSFLEKQVANLAKSAPRIASAMNTIQEAVLGSKRTSRTKPGGKGTLQ